MPRPRRTAVLLLLLAPLAGCADSTTASGGDGDGDGSGGQSGGTGGSGITQDPFRCERHSECAITTASMQCCSTCQPPSPGDVLAVNAAFSQQQIEQQCAGTSCPDIACAPATPRYLAACNAGYCEVLDLQGHPATACEDDASCRLRSTSCCECGASNYLGGFIPISGSEAELPLCQGDESCDDCLGAPPPDVLVTCNAGQCEAVDCNWPPGCPDTP